jgi:hypothetical protein
MSSECGSRKRQAESDGARAAKADRVEDLDAKLAKIGGPAYLDFTLCDDAVDAVSQDRIWNTNDAGKRVASNEVDYLFSWEEKVGKRKFVRGLSAGSMSRMMSACNGATLTHPVSGIRIPDEDLARAKEMVHLLLAAGKIEPPQDDFANLKEAELTDDKIRHFATSVCQLFSSKGGIYIDEAAFLSLTHSQLATVISELKDMFAQNFSDAQRREFGEMPFTSPPTSARGLQHYVLRECQRVVRASSGSTRTMVLYVLLGGLAVVSSQVRERYLDGMSHNFNLPP